MLPRIRDLLICAAMLVVLVYGLQLWAEQNFLAKLRLEQRARVAEQAEAECAKQIKALR
ncbi:MAG: hypothetical protein ACRDHF_13150 [Tepidiformaceae bacterium]